MTDVAPEDAAADGKVAIVLSGAGSRGAYEAGVLSVLLPLLKESDTPRIILGTSAGALNAAMLAGVIDRGVDTAAERLPVVWETIRPEKVFRTPRRGALTELGWHLRKPSGTAAGLVDTTPLEDTIEEIIQLNDIGHNIESTALEAVGVVASSCSTMRPVVFLQGRSAPRRTGEWIRYVETTLNARHLLASSAFPVAFPPVWVPGEMNGGGGGDWFVDGGIHLNTPLKPAIDLGADRILVVGGTPVQPVVPPSPTVSPTLGDSNGQILHALLVDSLEADLGRLRATNQCVKALAGSSTAPPGGSPAGPSHRVISSFMVNPIDDELDAEAARIYPSGFLSLLESFGGYRLLGTATSQRQRPGQFLSYICFDERFIRKAIEIGKADARTALAGSSSIPWSGG